MIEKTGREILESALSYRWVLRRSITHIDYVIIRREDFLDYLGRMRGKMGGFYGLTFIQLSFYFHAFRRAGMVAVLECVNEREQKAPRRVGVYFPSDDARVFYSKYFMEMARMRENGILDAREFKRFMESFFLSAPNHLLRIRTHMSPKIYAAEEKAVLESVRAVEEKYSGLQRWALALLRRALFVKVLPCHLLYVAFVLFRNKVLRRPRVSALELYERCLEGGKLDKSRLYKTDF